MSINWQRELRNFQIQDFLSKKRLENALHCPKCKINKSFEKNESSYKRTNEKDGDEEDKEQSKQGEADFLNEGFATSKALAQNSETSATSKVLIKEERQLPNVEFLSKKDYIIELSTLEFYELHNEKVKTKKNQKLVSAYLSGLLWCQKIKEQ